MTFSVPDALAARFLAAVPNRERSRTIAQMMEHVLAEQDSHLVNACRAANSDSVLNSEIAEWQSFDDTVVDP